MVATIVSPNVSPCASCTTARIAIGGACAVMTQRATALSAAMTTSIEYGSLKRGDSANSTISASTPNTHRPAIVSPPNPACCQAIEAKV